MCDGFNQLECAAMRKLSIGIERDHITNIGSPRSGLHQVLKLFFTIQQTIQFLELSTLSLPTDPTLLCFTPHARSIEKNKEPAGIAGVELFDSLYRNPQQVVVFRHLAIFRIREVCEEREIKIR